MAGTSTATENMLPMEVPKAGPMRRMRRYTRAVEVRKTARLSRGRTINIVKVRKWALELASSRTVDKDFDTDKIFWRESDIYSPPEDHRYGFVLRTDQFGLFNHQDGLSAPIRKLPTADAARLVRGKKALESALSERRRQRQQEGQQHDLDVAGKKSMRPTLGSNYSSNRSKEQGLGGIQQSSVQPSAVRRMFRHWKEAWNEGTIEDNILLIAYTLLALGIILSTLVYALLLLSRLGYSLGHICQGR
ncbi:hypothetical protein VSDG_03183 [Cytospora chrysosperma]|uniref:Uncharacterized protein n=1 Tax=Cytospora chrysosperma TaxID=252740 RepID=A0A423WBD5_CYTCH|nr:hypothetical protein VSDG_03183 [Valsa sordida]